MDDDQTQCTKCGQSWLASEFYWSKGKLKQPCKRCFAEWHRNRYTPKNGTDDAPRDCVVCGASYRPKGRRFSIYCSPACNDKARARTPHRRDTRLQREYGITLAEYEALLVAQDGGCAICGVKNPAGRWDKWHVDHCHDSQKVRGVLCSSCNHGIGQFKDDPALLRRAADYLEAVASV